MSKVLRSIGLAAASGVTAIQAVHCIGTAFRHVGHNRDSLRLFRRILRSRRRRYRPRILPITPGIVAPAPAGCREFMDSRGSYARDLSHRQQV